MTPKTHFEMMLETLKPHLRSALREIEGSPLTQDVSVEEKKKFVLAKSQKFVEVMFTTLRKEQAARYGLESMAFQYLVQDLVLYGLPDQFSYGHLIEDDLFNYLAGVAINAMRTLVRGAGKVPEDDIDQITRTNFFMFYSMASHERAGKRVYDVAPALAEKLRYTEVRGISTDDLRLPYRSIYVLVPPQANLQIWNNITGWHSVEGFYVTEDSSLWGATRPGIRAWRFLIVGKGKASKDDDALVYFNLELPDGKSLDECLKEAEEMRVVRSLGKENDEVWQSVFRWAMNLVLYCTWNEPKLDSWIANDEARSLWERIQKLPKNSGKRQELKDRFNSIDPQKRYRVGRTVVARGQESAKGAFHGTGHKQSTKVLVSGHWRKQPYGPQSSLRKWIWVEPYWKNLDGTEVEKTHEVH
jgi:hypothetical protein